MSGSRTQTPNEAQALRGGSAASTSSKQDGQDSPHGAEVRIDDEFSALIPPLTADERRQLEVNLMADGCLDALVVWREKGVLLDGHHRHEICQKLGIRFSTRSISLASRDAAKAWIIRNQFGRRNLTPYQRSELALKLKPLIAKRAKENERRGGGSGPSGRQQSDNPVDTKVEVAHLAGVSHDTIAKAEYIRDHADDKVQEKLRRGESSINAVYRKLRKAEARKERERRKGAASAAPLPADRCRLICTDIAEAHKHVEAESVDSIITDPPYGRKHLDLYDYLGQFAAHALKRGSSLIAMSGQSYLPDIMTRLGAHLQYQWMLAYLTPGGQSAQLWERRVNTFWKPLLWFTKGRYDGDWVGDVCQSATNDNDKQHHRWGQSESGMADILQRFTDPGQTVCDPFCGGGTTGVVAVRMNRLFIGIDCDQEAIDTTKRRLSEVHLGA